MPDHRHEPDDGPQPPSPWRKPGSTPECPVCGDDVSTWDGDGYKCLGCGYVH